LRFTTNQVWSKVFIIPRNYRLIVTQKIKWFDFCSSFTTKIFFIKLSRLATAAMNNLSQFKWMIIPMVCLGTITCSVILSSCKEKPIKEIEPIETLVPPTNETDDDDDDTDKTIIHVGSAEGGNLVIDGTRLPINSNTIVEIASATYQTITIRNIPAVKKTLSLFVIMGWLP